MNTHTNSDVNIRVCMQLEATIAHTGSTEISHISHHIYLALLREAMQCQNKRHKKILSTKLNCSASTSPEYVQPLAIFASHVQ